MRRVIKMSLLSLALLASAALAENNPFKVYCADGKITVDQRSFTEMKKTFSPDVCAFGEFDSASQAEAYATKFGSSGAKCSCR